MKKIVFSLIAIFVLGFTAEQFAQQRITARGDRPYRKVGVHRGNQVRTVFTNSGVIAQPGAEGPRGSWRYDNNGYVGDVSPVVGVMLPVRDYNKDTLIDSKDTIHSVVITPVERPGGGDFAPGGKFWGFEPLPGFARDTVWGSGSGKGVAMSNLPSTWPTVWPDQPTWRYSGDGPIQESGVPVLPTVDWNGYFGRAQFNADQESYYWMDDAQDEKMYVRHGFYPDMTDTSRRGQALQVSVRGLQWSNFLAQDVLFWLYNIKNDGTQIYEQTAFGTLVGTYVGIDGSEWNDDASFFDVRQSITYTWDFDKYISPSANPRWLPNPSAVGYIAYAFLESPGNPYDGIDNDGDGVKGTPTTGPKFVAADFTPRTIRANDKLVLIAKDSTYKRTLFTMPNDTVTVYSMGQKFFLRPNVTQLVEGDIDALGNVNKNSTDGFDNDLDGVIDESYVVNYRQFKKSPEGTVLIDTLTPVQYKDYVTGAGTGDFLMDERRDDNIDNDRDWNPQYDDVGADGKAGTNDIGEGDGRPTHGEPNFDETDVDESDQLGLTSFQYFVPANDIKMNDEEDMWRRLRPGYFDVPRSIQNNVAVRGEDGDFIYGSGYFPLLPGKTERFSVALAFGEDFGSVIGTKRVAQIIYNANYNFPRPPEKPTLTVVPGNKQVTLYWDDIAEKSIDPTLKERDFEGYKIYKGTDPDFTDALQISNGSGQKVFYKPIAQFDLKDGISGYYVASPAMYALTNGAPFYLGNESGIQNSYVDKDVLNGRTYYYAVVAYDRGKETSTLFQTGIFPSENTRFIAKDATGKITTDKNTAVVIPNAPVSGYQAPTGSSQLARVTGASTGGAFMEVVDPIRLKSGTFFVSFRDTVINKVSLAKVYDVVDSASGRKVVDSSKVSTSNGVIFNGLRLSFNTDYQSPDSITYIVDPAVSGWKINNPKPDTVIPPRFLVTRYEDPTINLVGPRIPRDYALVFSNTYADSSNAIDTIIGYPIGSLPVKTKINFKAYDVTDRKNPKRVKFIFFEGGSTKNDTLSSKDVLILSNETGSLLSWYVYFSDQSDTNRYTPKGGDTLLLSFKKPISANDKFVARVNAAQYLKNDVAAQLERVKAVPNPYVVTNVFEQPLAPQLRGRGERIVNFVNLPPKSKIHIFTSSGNHIRDLEHNGDIFDGSVKWDLRTKEGLDVAYGVYFYVVEVEGISDKKYGKLAIIK